MSAPTRQVAAATGTDGKPAQNRLSPDLALGGDLRCGLVQSGGVKLDHVTSRRIACKTEVNDGFSEAELLSRRGGRVVECAGFENRSARKGSGSSNLPLSVFRGNKEQ